MIRDAASGRIGPVTRIGMGTFVEEKVRSLLSTVDLIISLSLSVAANCSFIVDVKGVDCADTGQGNYVEVVVHNTLSL